jgi:hypothetical protein
LQSIYKAENLVVVNSDQAFSASPILRYDDFERFSDACKIIKSMHAMADELYYDFSNDTVPHINYTFSPDGRAVEVRWFMSTPRGVSDTQYVFKLVYDEPK